MIIKQMIEKIEEIIEMINQNMYPQSETKNVKIENMMIKSKEMIEKEITIEEEEMMMIKKQIKFSFWTSLRWIVRLRRINLKHF